MHSSYIMINLFLIEMQRWEHVHTNVLFSIVCLDSSSLLLLAGITTQPLMLMNTSITKKLRMAT
jgi:hypothetical protein